MGKNFTRSLIMLLCISMITALCGISAFAENTAVAEIVETGKKYTDFVQAFYDASYDAQTIRMLDDVNVTLSEALEFNLFGSSEVFTIDLNGHDINFGLVGGSKIHPAIFMTGRNGKFVIKGNGSINAEGRAIEVQSGIFAEPNVAIENGAAVISKSEVALFISTGDAVVDVSGTVKSQAEDAGAIMGDGDYATGTGSITIHDGACVEAVNHAIYCPQGGSLNITGGTIKSKDTTAIEVRRGSLNISGNPTIETDATSYSVKENKSGATTVGAAVAIAPYDTSTMNISISGGTFTGKEALSYANPNKVANPDVTINVTGGTFSTAITDALTNAEVKSNFDKLAVVKDSNGYTYSVSDAAVASVGETTYPSLEAAFAKAATGDTITLLANAKVYSRININNGKKLTLNLGNFNIDNEHSDRLFYVKDGALTVTGQGTVTNNNNDVFAVSGNTDATTWATAIDSVLTIEKDVKVVSGGDCCVFYNGNGAAVYVYGNLTSNGAFAAIQGNGAISDKENNGGTKLYIYDGAEIKSTYGTYDGQNYYATIYHPQNGSVFVKGGKIESMGSSGIEMRRGSLEVTGGTIISGATKFTCVPNGSGGTTDGAAIALAPHNNCTMDISISGGTFTAPKALSYANPNKVVNPNVTINVTGGTFSTDITDALTNAEVKSNIKEYAVAANADGTYGVKARDEKFEKVAAVQRNTNKKLTFLAGINYLDYEKAGFRVTVGNITKEVSTGTVYTKLDNNGTTSVSVDDFKTNYFFAADFEVLDTSITEFTITPFAKLLNGEEVTGTETKVKVGGAE